MTSKAVPAFATLEMLQALAAPTPREEVKTRPAKGASGGLSYIDARFVFDRFDSALGPHLWQVEILWSSNIELEPRLTKGGDVIEGTEAHGSLPLARIGVLTEYGWVWKCDIGDYSDIASVKGGVSDAIKRAAVQWGVARDLYDPSSAARTTEKKARPTKAVAEQAEQAVVGRTGLSDAQRGKLFAALRKAGVKDEDRKAMVLTVTRKHSVKDMTDADLDLMLTFLDGAQVEPSDG